MRKTLVQFIVIIAALIGSIQSNAQSTNAKIVWFVADTSATDWQANAMFALGNGLDTYGTGTGQFVALKTNQIADASMISFTPSSPKRLHAGLVYDGASTTLSTVSWVMSSSDPSNKMRYESNLVANAFSSTIFGMDRSTGVQYTSGPDHSFNRLVFIGAGNAFTASVAPIQQYIDQYRPWSMKIEYTVAGVKTSSSVLFHQPAVPPPIVYPSPLLTVPSSTNAVVLGQGVTFNWNSINATKVTLNGEDVGTNGTKTVFPVSNTNYIFVAGGPGGTIQKIVEVTVTTPQSPQLTFTASTNSVVAGTNGFVSFTWITANATTTIFNGETVSNSGSRTVWPTSTTDYKVIATGTGGVVQSNILITVTIPNPILADFIVSSANAKLLVQFVDRSTGPVNAWHWNFGDGTTSDLQNPTHTYSVGTNYVVTLTVTGNGMTNVNTSVIEVTPPPPIPPAMADFRAEVVKESWSTIQFLDLSTGKINAWGWDFGDGTLGTSQNPIHDYGTNGEFTVSLTVFGDANTNSLSAIVVVKAPPPKPPQILVTASLVPTTNILPKTLLMLTGTISNYGDNFVGVLTNVWQLKLNNGKWENWAPAGTITNLSSGELKVATIHTWKAGNADGTVYHFRLVSNSMDGEHSSEELVRMVSHPPPVVLKIVKTDKSGQATVTLSGPSGTYEIRSSPDINAQWSNWILAFRATKDGGDISPITLGRGFENSFLKALLIE